MYNFFPEISIMKTKKLNTKPKSKEIYCLSDMINVARIKALFPESMLNDDYSIPIP